MKPGPPKKPTHLRLLTGNAGKRPINKDEPKARVGIPPPPDWLSPYAREAWDRYTPLLEKYRVITDLDEAVLIGFCTAYADFRLARERLGDTPKLVVAMRKKNGDEYLMPNPYLSVSNKALRLMHNFLAELGLTPAARSSIIAGNKQIPGASDDDPFGLFA